VLDEALDVQLKEALSIGCLYVHMKEKKEKENQNEDYKVEIILYINVI
jgi:hypothetical protein